MGRMGDTDAVGAAPDGVPQAPRASSTAPRVRMRQTTAVKCLIESEPFPEQGWDDHTQERTICEPDITSRRTLIDLLAKGQEHAVDDAHQVFGTLEGDRTVFQLASTFDKYLCRAIHHDLADTRVLDQWL